MSDQPITDQYLDEIEVRYNAATPGPWGCRIDVGDTFYVHSPSYGVRDFCCLSGGFGRREDAEFIAYSRTDIPRMAAEIRRLRAEAQNTKPVRHGRWREIRDPYGHLKGWIHEECGFSDSAAMNFCANCGARMDADAPERGEGSAQ